MWVRSGPVDGSLPGGGTAGPHSLPDAWRRWAWVPVSRAEAGEKAGQSLISPNINLDLLSLGQSHSTVPGDPRSRDCLFYPLRRTPPILCWGAGQSSGYFGLVEGISVPLTWTVIYPPFVEITGATKSPALWRLHLRLYLSAPRCWRLLRLFPLARFYC